MAEKKAIRYPGASAFREAYTAAAQRAVPEGQFLKPKTPPSPEKDELQKTDE